MSLPFTFLGLGACKRSNVGHMTKFMVGVGVCGVGAVLNGLAVNFGEVYEYATTKSTKGLQMWKVLMTNVKSFTM